MTNYYKVLGISRNASRADIEAAYISRCDILGSPLDAHIGGLFLDVSSGGGAGGRTQENGRDRGHDQELLSRSRRSSDRRRVAAHKHSQVDRDIGRRHGRVSGEILATCNGLQNPHVGFDVPLHGSVSIAAPG
ncbi:hypothetical protein NPX13_g7195 [Xylaria arbuscula]|uniref:J domain-containing protein n=1 Tax=Xylaria arbuscula TaxID=114810 RepID=A0A9W8NAG5_9PEZI|nr:hypothetical protein NPX13_g7195 [Xylaria arbuscula]